MCYGTCPIYKLTIFSNGRVEWDGDDFVKVKGKASARLSAGELAALKTAFSDAKYLKLGEGYDCREVTDLPSANTSYDDGTRKKSINHYLGCRSKAGVQTLSALEAKIDQIAKTDRWIGTRESPRFRAYERTHTLRNRAQAGVTLAPCPRRDASRRRRSPRLPLYSGPCSRWPTRRSRPSPRSAWPSWPASTRPRSARTSPTSGPTAPGASATTSSTCSTRSAASSASPTTGRSSIVGVGNLGHALANYRGFGARGFRIVAAGRRRPDEGRRERRRPHRRVARRPARDRRASGASPSASSPPRRTRPRRWPTGWSRPASPRSSTSPRRS